jgi:hypothetical protein
MKDKEVNEEINEDDLILEVEEEIYWTPEQYGFKKIVGDGIERGSKWTKDKFILIRLSNELWVLKKSVGYITTDKGKQARLVTKFHLIIDRKSLADIYFTSGLRG